MPSGGPSGSSGTGTGPSANVYTPANQPTADYNYQNILQSLINAGTGPGGQAYPQAQAATANIYNNPYVNQAISGAYNAAQYGQGVTLQDLASMGALSTAGSSLLPGSSEALNIGFNPAYGQIVNQATNNPYYGNALAGAQTGAQLGGAGAQALQGAGMQLLGTGFDPQQALFNRTQQQTLDAANAANAAAGIGSTPYGASVTANALGNFGINWQNQQLARQQAALSGAQPALTAAPGLAATSAGLPSSVYTGQLGQILSALNAQNTAGAIGSQSASNLIGAAGNAFGQGAGLGSTGVNTLAQSAALPYQASTGAALNSLGALGQQVNIGNQQYTLPQQTLQDLQSYLGLGQSASGLSGQLGNLGFNQTAAGIGGGLAGANALIGNNGLLTSGLLGNATGLSGLASGGANALPGVGSLDQNFSGGSSFLDALPFVSAAGS